MGESVLHLPRGGTQVRTSAGTIQFGLPPETIKDAMAMKLDPPALYVVPKEPFDRASGVNVAEFEFPAYYSFFLLKKKVRLLVEDAGVERRLRTVIEESLFGPGARGGARADEFADSIPPDGRPDFAKESEFFRKSRQGERITADSLIEFSRFDGKPFRLGAVEIEHAAGGGYAVRDCGRELARVPEHVFLPEVEVTGELGRFEPPAFGVTVLGASHGFDPSGKTTGFIVWIGGRGLMVDPPVGSSGLLRQNGLSPKMIEGVILTHCHADHDSGTFQRLLLESRVDLYTTPTILGSFLRKYSSLSGLSPDVLRRTFTFRPVVIGEAMRIRAAEFRFFYTLHSIPTVGFEAFYGGRSLAVSADTLYDPERIRAMHDAGVIGARRRDDLLAFPWHRSLVLHEAGIPPLHTPVSALAALPEESRRNLYLVHIAQKDLHERGLKTAPVGLPATIRLPVEASPNEEAMAILDALCAVDLFRELTLASARDLLQVARRVRHPAGTRIIAEGDAGDTFYVVAAGEVAVVRGTEQLKSYRTGDYFGETALILHQPRNADVFAKTDVELVEIDRFDFLHVLRGTDLLPRLARLAKIRDEHSWELFNLNSVLRALTSAQKTQLQSYLEIRKVAKDEPLWKAGAPASEAVIVDEGEIVLEGEHGALPPFGAGALLGEFDAILAGGPASTSARAVAAGRVFRLGRDSVVKFLSDYPGLRVSFLGTRFLE